MDIKTYDLVVFDLYGTLIRFGVMHHPFRQLLKFARENGRQVRPDDARRLMTIDGDLSVLAEQLNISAPKKYLLQLQQCIDEEVASLTLFDDVIPTLEKLVSLDVSIAVCSNLAQPYGVVIDRLLSRFDLKLFLSYEIGFIKPEAVIYQKILAATGCSGENCLFVGDTYVADYEGPINNGFNARHLIRGARPEDHVIGSLSDLFP
jgi:HAD superfamily hydrolase (TIGR01549 family)